MNGVSQPHDSLTVKWLRYCCLAVEVSIYFDTLRLLHDSCLDLASHAPPIHGSQVALCACRPLRWNLIPQAVSTSGQLHSYGGQTKIDKQRGQ